MKHLTVYTIALFIGMASVSKAGSNLAKSDLVITETPAKTICIKNATAADANKFFSTTKNLFFEVYKPGSKSDFMAIIEKLKSMEGVENCVAGKINGDYYAVTLTLKTTKDKAWFMKAFKEVGLEHIKINNNEVVAVDKL